MQESLFLSYLLGKFSFRVLASERRLQGLMTTINVLIFLCTQASSFLAFLTPLTDSSFLPFYKSEFFFQIWLFQRNGGQISFLVQFHVNLGILMFQCSKSYFMYLILLFTNIAFNLCYNLANNITPFLPSQQNVWLEQSKILTAYRSSPAYKYILTLRIFKNLLSVLPAFESQHFILNLNFLILMKYWKYYQYWITIYAWKQLAETLLGWACVLQFNTDSTTPPLLHLAFLLSHFMHLFTFYFWPLSIHEFVTPWLY